MRLVWKLFDGCQKFRILGNSNNTLRNSYFIVRLVHYMPDSDNFHHSCNRQTICSLQKIQVNWILWKSFRLLFLRCYSFLYWRFASGMLAGRKIALHRIVIFFPYPLSIFLSCIETLRFSLINPRNSRHWFCCKSTSLKLDWPLHFQRGSISHCCGSV